MKLAWAEQLIGHKGARLKIALVIMVLLIFRQMKHLYIILFLFIMVFGSCTKDDDYLETEIPQVDIFAPSVDATDDVSVLRREFFKTTGIYLLFNDTLSSYETTSLSGDRVEVTQMFNASYSMVSSNRPDKFRFSYYNDAELQKLAADFVIQNVLTRIPKVMQPFSFLLTDTLLVSEYSFWIENYEQESRLFYAGLQGTALALGNISLLTDKEKSDLGTSIVKNIILNEYIRIPPENFDVFYSYSNQYYGSSALYNIPEPYASVGFLDRYIYSMDVDFNDPDIDVRAYLEEIFELTEAEFRTKYQDYPICIEKMEELVKVMKAHGVILYE